MFSLLFQRFRTSTLFEKLLLIMGLVVGIIGFWLINKVYYNEPGLTWQFLIAVFLWFSLILFFILTDSNESIKEELSAIMKEQIEETKLMKQEIKLLNESLFKKKKKNK